MRQRVGKILFWLAALVVCGVPPFFINNLVGYLPLLMLVLGTFVSFSYLKILARSLSYSEATLAPSCERGSQVEFAVEFTNHSPLVFLRLEPRLFISDLFGEIVTEMPASITLMPHETRQLKFAGRFEHIGSYTAGVSSIEIGDLFGLFSHTIAGERSHEVRVLPRLFDVSRVDLQNVTVSQSSTLFKPLITDDMDYAGVRGYEPGDPLKTIHWNLSARTADGSYLTRLFETHTSPGVDIILDVSAEEADAETLMFQFDALVESALSLNSFARERGIDAQIRYLDKHETEQVRHVAGPQEFETLVVDMPRIRLGAGQRELGILTREGNSIHGMSNIAFCTTHISEEVASTLIQMKLHKRNPVLFAAVPRGLSERELSRLLRPLKRLDLAGIPYYAVNGEVA